MGSQLHLLYVVLMAERLSGSPIWMVLTSGWSHAWPARRDFRGAQCWSGSLGKQGAAGCAWALRGLCAGAASPCPSALAAGTGGAMQRRLSPRALRVPRHARKPRDIMPGEADNI